MFFSFLKEIEKRRTKFEKGNGDWRLKLERMSMLRQLATILWSTYINHYVCECECASVSWRWSQIPALLGPLYFFVVYDYNLCSPLKNYSLWYILLYFIFIFENTSVVLSSCKSLTNKLGNDGVWWGWGHYALSITIWFLNKVRTGHI